MLGTEPGGARYLLDGGVNGSLEPGRGRHRFAEPVTHRT
jgi:hypothetical protein